jgi:hypothetical protein
LRKRRGAFRKQDHNTRAYSVWLPTQVADSVERIARSEGKLVDQLLLELIISTTNDRIETMEGRLSRIVGLIHEMEISISKTPMQEEKDATSKIGQNDV